MYLISLGQTITFLIYSFNLSKIIKYSKIKNIKGWSRTLNLTWLLKCTFHQTKPWSALNTLNTYFILPVFLLQKHLSDWVKKKPWKRHKKKIMKIQNISQWAFSWTRKWYQKLYKQRWPYLPQLDFVTFLNNVHFHEINFIIYVSYI